MDFQMRARNLVAAYINDRIEKTDGVNVAWDDTYVVWFCYILGGWKCLISTNLIDGMYYEVTHNKDKGETYLDAYKKWDNVCVPDNTEQ